MADNGFKKLLKLLGRVRFKRTADNVALVKFWANNRQEVYPIESDEFKSQLVFLHMQKFNKPPKPHTVKDAILALKARALHQGKLATLYNRVGRQKNNIQIDLLNMDKDLVKITPKSVEVIHHTGVVFNRVAGMGPLTLPDPEGDLSLLAPLVNLPDRDSLILAVSWLVGALFPDGPYPILILQGEHGAAKTTLAKLLRLLIDPNQTPLRYPPRNPQDLMIMAKNSWVVALDNVTRLPEWLSNSLCSLATGGGYTTRKLYSNDAETHFSACRPILINGIDVIAYNNDLMDRAIILQLPPIPDEKRVPESELLAKFKMYRPKILGALYLAVSQALKALPDTPTEELPRMADFAQRVIAAEPALPWQPGEFLKAYQASIRESFSQSLENDLVGKALLEFMAEKEESADTVSGLLDSLDTVVGDREKASKAWPKTPGALSHRINLVSPLLRKAGIEVERTRAADKRVIRLMKKKEKRRVFIRKKK
jgi:hypothetical protein